MEILISVFFYIEKLYSPVLLCVPVELWYNYRCRAL